MSGPQTIELDGQYRALREEAGFVVRDGRGHLDVTGADAAEYLEGQLTNEVEALEPGAGTYAALLDRKGHMQGDMRVLRVAPDVLWIDLELEALPAVLRHLSMYKVGRDAEVSDASQGRTVVSVIGPAAARVTGAPPPSAVHAHSEFALDGAACRAVATDLGLDLICSASDADALTRALESAGALAVSEDAAEIVRVESGRPRFGREMTQDTIPQEAGINDRAVSFTKGCYIGQETVARLHYKGKPNRHLRGLRPERHVSAGDEVLAGEKPVGRVGTAVVSPDRGPIALAILRREAQPGGTVTVGNGIAAEVVELPF